jgi:hypothetical protein
VSKQGLYFGRDDVNKPGQAYFDDDVFIQKGYKLYLTDGNLQAEADGIGNASWIIAPLDTVVQHVVDGNVYLELDHTNGRVKSLKQVMLGDNGYMVLNDNEIDVSSGNLTLDVAGNIALEAGGGEVTMDAPLTITNTNTPQLKLIDQSGEYAQMAVTGSGDLTITTVGSGTTDSDINLTADGNINLSIAAGELIATSGLAASWAFNHANRRFRLYGSDGAVDWLEFTSGANGASTISTIDASTGTDADLTLDADGAIKLDSHTGEFVAAQAGDEFSVANSAYAGMILGYTYNHPSSLTYHLLTTSLTVEDTTNHKVVFKTPPSEKVEIEVSAFFDRALVSDVAVYMGLSLNSSYSSMGDEWDYDFSTGVGHADDEADDTYITAKFVLQAAELEAIGVSNTVYLGLASSVTNGVRLRYGHAGGRTYPPMIIKAVALPATIQAE